MLFSLLLFLIGSGWFGSGFKFVEVHDQIAFNNQLKNYSVPIIENAFGVDIMGAINDKSLFGHEIGIFTEYSQIHIRTEGRAIPPEYVGRVNQAIYDVKSEFLQVGAYYDFIYKFDNSLQYRIGVQYGWHNESSIRSSIVFPILKLNNDEVRVGISGKYRLYESGTEFGPINFKQPRFSLGTEIIF